MPLRLPRHNLLNPSQSLPSQTSTCACLRTPPASHPFSTTPRPQGQTRLRRSMFRWLEGPGSVFRDPVPGSTNYLNAYNSSGEMIRAKKNDSNKDPSDPENPTAEDSEVEMNIQGGRPLPREKEEDLIVYPENSQFRSQAVLSEELKEKIYEQVMKGGTVREVSVRYRVDMRRVGAVVRLKSVEREWEEKGIPLASVYSKAVLAMLPQTTPNSVAGHESINDLPVHQSTTVQMFYPTSESRHFTRVDAGEAFEKGLLPADQRIPHPEMVELLRADRSLPQERGPREAAVREKWRREDNRGKARARYKDVKKEKNTTTVRHGRWEFKFQDVKVDRTTTGKYVDGVGVRYGVAPQDRKKGEVKIPKMVE